MTKRIAILLTAFAALYAHGDGVRHSLYAPEQRLLAEPDAGQEYIWFGGKPVAQFDDAQGTVRWTFDDHLKTPILQTDNHGAVQWRREVEPYGGTYAQRAGAGLRQPLGFPGQESGEEDGLVYNVNRWYRPSGGRYTQADPIGLGASLNLYSYSSENPVTWSDPLGLMPVHSSCEDGQCGGCGFALRKTAEQLHDFFRPGWGRSKPKCHQMLADLARNHPGPGPFGAITCMEQASNSMTIKCTGDFGANGGPPLTTAIDPSIVWIQEKGCRNRGLPGSLLNIVFHEALHNCGAPPDAGLFAGQTLAYDITDTCLAE